VSLKENCTPSSHTGQEQLLSILEYWETSVRKITNMMMMMMIIQCNYTARTDSNGVVTERMMQ